MAYKLKKQKSQQYEDYILYGDKEKDEEMFRVPDNKEKEEETKLFQMDEDKNQFIQDLNDDLSADNIPIQVKDKYTLIVKATGQEHKITRKDIAEYNRKYALEDGSESRPYTAFKTLGSINGEREKVDNIYKESNKVFAEIDEHSGGFHTISSDEY